MLLIAYSTQIYVIDSSPQQVSFYLVEVATLGMRKLTDPKDHILRVVISYWEANTMCVCVCV